MVTELVVLEAKKAEALGSSSLLFMSNKTIEMFTIRQILRLYASGKGTKSISQSTGIARNTIKKYLYRYVLSEKTMEQIEKMSDAEMSRLFLIKEPIKTINKCLSPLNSCTNF